MRLLLCAFFAETACEKPVQSTHFRVCINYVVALSIRLWILFMVAFSHARVHIIFALLQERHTSACIKGGYAYEQAYMQRGLCVRACARV
jgi:hypothetical protein